MSVWIVFEYANYGNKVIGVYKEEAMAIEEHNKFPTWRYVEEHEVE